MLGAINDCVPIFGYRRKPYMAFGWFLCASMLLLLYVWPMPPPYYCVNATTGSYILEEPRATLRAHALGPLQHYT